MSNHSPNRHVQRFTKGKACPVCGGSETDDRGVGKRCYGFISGEWIHCTREDFANGCTFHSGSDTFSHRLKGKCLCGVEHNPADPKPTDDKPGEIDHVYKYRDSTGNVA